MAEKHPVPDSVWRNPIHFLAFGCGSGTVKTAPGTFGTLAAIPLYLLIQDLSVGHYFLLLVFASLIGIFICGKTSEDLGVHDHSGIVWDEFVGFWITMWMAPQGWGYIALGFILFRLFDILKPWPISLADKHIPGGFGIMFDDILAGILAFFALQAIITVF